MRAIKAIEDRRGTVVYINPASVSMWRPHWVGKSDHDPYRTDVFFFGERQGFTICMTPEEFTAKWELCDFALR